MSARDQIENRVACFQFRAGGTGHPRGFVHYECAPEWIDVVLIPAADLADERCVLCRRPMVPHG